MKTEQEIAKENIGSWKTTENLLSHGICRTHAQTCQRWLEFLEFIAYCPKGADCCKKIAVKQVTDLKKAIKIYKEAGIWKK